jgi:hypothetical protein
VPIQEHPVEGLATGITMDLAFEELEACVAAGESIVDWLRCTISNYEKTVIVAWYRAHGLRQQHTSDAEAKEMKKKHPGH